MIWPVVLGSLPWLLLWAYVAAFVREPPRLPVAGGARRGRRGPAPAVSVIVPARNEAHNIAACVGSLVASEHPDFEVIVVDDRSEDGTGERARAVDRGRARRVLVVEGEPVPAGWFGKQWACWQGMRHARGALLLFTDADTTHGPSLLADAAAEVEATGADCVTVIGRQIMLTFWERLVQPQVFTLMAIRYPRLGREPLPRRRWRSAIANGQYLLFRREAYERLGGHEAVRWEAAEDLRLAQRLVRAGGRLVIRSAPDGLGTRMYRGLDELVRGWSKNIIQAGLQTVPAPLRPFTPAAMLLSGAFFWLLPPAVLVAALLGAGGGTLLAWAAATTGIGVLFWAERAVRFGAPAWVGPLFPLGALAGHGIVLRSWLGSHRVEWKGRSYSWDVYSDGEEPAAATRVHRGVGSGSEAAPPLD